MKTFDELAITIRKLREECPWDKKQTHHSLRKYVIEEAYELVEAIESGDGERIKDELADLLTQIMLHTAIAEDNKEFSMNELLEHHIRKLKRRHPHVFGGAKAETEQDVLSHWVRIKKEEKMHDSVMDDIPRLPGLLKAAKIQKRASAMGFDWEHIEYIYDKIAEEIDELRKAEDKQHREEELGDILLALSHLANHMKIDPEVAINRAVYKFIDRFREVEKAIYDSERKLTLEEMETVWQETKKKG